MNRAATRRAVLSGLLTAPFLIASCASHSPGSGQFGLKDEPSATTIQRYAGRISLVFDEAAQGVPTSFSGAFELRGQPQAGELDLLTPLGSIAAQLQWQPGSAVMIQAGQTRSYASADELIASATGTMISAQQLFDWLQGSSNTHVASEWQVDLARHAEGRITARRTGQQAATLRIILEKP